MFAHILSDWQVSVEHELQSSQKEAERATKLLQDGITKRKHLEKKFEERFQVLFKLSGI